MITLTYTEGYHGGMLHRVVLDQGRSEPFVGNRRHKPLNVMAPVSSTVKSMSMSKSVVEQTMMACFGMVPTEAPSTCGFEEGMPSSQATLN